MSGKWGMIAGVMQGAQRASEIWLTAEMEKQKQERMQQFANDSYAMQRADQLADKESDREHAKGVLTEQRAYDEAQAIKSTKAKAVKDNLDAQTKAMESSLAHTRDQIVTIRDNLSRLNDVEMTPDTISLRKGLEADLDALVELEQEQTNNLGRLRGWEPGKKLDIGKILEGLKLSTPEEQKQNLAKIKVKYGSGVVEELQSELAKLQGKSQPAPDAIKTESSGRGQPAYSKPAPTTNSNQSSGPVLSVDATSEGGPVRANASGDWMEQPIVPGIISFFQEEGKRREQTFEQGYSDREFNSAKKNVFGDIKAGRKPNPKIISRLLAMKEKGAPMSDEELSILQQYL